MNSDAFDSFFDDAYEKKSLIEIDEPKNGKKGARGNFFRTQREGKIDKHLSLLQDHFALEEQEIFLMTVLKKDDDAVKV